MKRHRPIRGRHQGFVLPLVLVCGVLLVVMVVSFQFISSADYRQVARLQMSVQATALADTAADEVHIALEQVGTGTAATRPAWLQSVLEALDQKVADLRDRSDPVVAVTKTQPMALDALRLTRDVAQKARDVVSVSGVSLTVGPFERLGAGGPVDMVYKEEIYGDGAKDLRAWDLRGPVNVVVSVAGDRGPFSFGQTYRRGQLLEIRDTVPPAAEFGLFAHMPPPAPEYALNDMQSGGTLVIDPGPGTIHGRVMVRGPLLIMPEEAPNLTAAAAGSKPIYLGGGLGNAPLSPAGSTYLQSYPDGQWAGLLAAVPGPRETQHPDAQAGAGPISLGEVGRILDGILTTVDPRRPIDTESHSLLKTKPYQFRITAEAPSPPCPPGIRRTKNKSLPPANYDMGGVSLSAFRQDTSAVVYQTIDRDPAAYYPPAAYFYCPVGHGGQRFLVRPMPSLSSPARLADERLRGLHARVGGGEVKGFALGAPRSEGDTVTLEPVGRGTTPAAQNMGLVGLYGVGLLDGKTYYVTPVSNLGRWLMDKFIEEKGDQPAVDNFLERLGAVLICGRVPTIREAMEYQIDGVPQKELILAQMMSQIGITDATKFMIRRFRVDGRLNTTSPPRDLTPTQVERLVGAHEALVAPYASYVHEAGYWNAAAAVTTKNAMMAALKEPDAATRDLPYGRVFDLLLRRDGNPQIDVLDPAWPRGTMPPPPTPATEVRRWLVETYAGGLLKGTIGADATGPEAAAAVMREAARGRVLGLSPLPLELRKRPQGAFGPLAGGVAAADPQILEAIRTEYPRGFFPPKYRSWEGVATRSYETMDDYLRAETVDGTLDLKGVVLIRTMRYRVDDTPGRITYRGRGMIVALTTEIDKPAILNAQVEIAGGAPPDSWLILAHRIAPQLVTPQTVREHMIDRRKVPPLRLGPRVMATVYSDTGVAPVRGNTVVSGNVAVGLINKQGTAPGDQVTVLYDPRARQADPSAGLLPYWTAELAGEVTSVEPGS